MTKSEKNKQIKKTIGFIRNEYHLMDCYEIDDVDDEDIILVSLYSYLRTLNIDEDDEDF